jgi:hypothetical protein
MKTSVVLAALAAVGFIAAGSAANAASMGTTGTTGEQACYHMLPNQVIVTCDHAGPGVPGETFGQATENGSTGPLYTGSIGTSPAAAAPGGMVMVDSPQQCRPGAYWVLHNPNDDIPMNCPSS